MPLRPTCRLPLLRALAALLATCVSWPALAQAPGGFADPPRPPEVIASSRIIALGGGTIQVDFAQGPLDLSPDLILLHIHAAADAIIAYYGRLPVARAQILVVPVQNTRGEMGGTTWPGHDGFDAFTRLRIGHHFTPAQLADDWVTTHEMVHWAFPSMPDDQHWIEEGTATYVEPLARVMTGDLHAPQVWADMVHGMPNGEPASGDDGMDRTHTWGRTYWGGALFCLVADVEIRRQTNNRFGLRDALRAIVAVGGVIDHDWTLDKALEVGDRATGTHVLTTMYAAWKNAAVPVDLPRLWTELGVHSVSPGGGIEFISSAPLANIRQAIAGDPNPPASLALH